MNSVLETMKSMLYEGLLKIETFMTSSSGDWVIKGILLFIVLLGILFFFQVSKEQSYELNLFKKTYRKEKKENKIYDVLLTELKRNLKSLMIEKGKPVEKADTYINVILAILISIGILLAMVKQPVFAFVIPIILLFIVSKTSGMIQKSFNDYVLAQLPVGIDNLIRVFSRYEDLKDVLFEAGETLPDPLGTIFQNLASQMQTKSPGLVLNEFMADSNDVWISCLIFNLLSYVEDAQKADVLDNLRELKEIVERDNRTRKKQKMERKLSTYVNYVVSAIAILAFIANLMFNRATSVAFFFGSVGGLLCFLGGMSLLIISLFSNLIIGSGKD